MSFNGLCRPSDQQLFRSVNAVDSPGTAPLAREPDWGWGEVGDGPKRREPAASYLCPINPNYRGARRGEIREAHNSCKKPPAIRDEY